MKNNFRLVAFLLPFCSLLLLTIDATASAGFKLRDYAEAARANDTQKMVLLRSYILGAAETHILYSNMFRDWTGINLFCTGSYDLNMNELGKIFEVKIMTLRKRYGEDIMDMPVANAVQMMVEEQYKCF